MREVDFKAHYYFFTMVSWIKPNMLIFKGFSRFLLLCFLVCTNHADAQTLQSIAIKVGNKNDLRAYYFEDKGLIIRYLDRIKMEYQYNFYNDDFEFQKSLRTKAHRGRFRYYHDEPSQLKMYNKNHSDYTVSLQTENCVVQCCYNLNGKIQFTVVSNETQTERTFEHITSKGIMEVQLKILGDILISFIKYKNQVEILSLSCKDGVMAKSVVNRIPDYHKIVVDTKTGQFEFNKIDGNAGYMYSNCFVELNDEELQTASGLCNIAGFFISAQRNGKQEFIKYFNFSELPEYTQYLKDNLLTTWATDKHNIQRDLISNNTHTLKESNGNYFQIIECFAESKTHYDPNTGKIEKSFFPASYSNGVYVEGGENKFVKGNKVFRTIFAGYDHLFFCLNKFDSVGTIVWEKCFAFGLDANPYNQYKLVNSEIDDVNQHIKLTYLTKNYVNHIVLDFDGNLVSEKKSEKLLIYFDKNYCASEYLNLRFWNSNYYVISEIQDRFTNAKETKEAEFFFIEKVKY